MNFSFYVFVLHFSSYYFSSLSTLHQLMNISLFLLIVNLFHKKLFCFFRMYGKLSTIRKKLCSSSSNYYLLLWQEKWLLSYLSPFPFAARTRPLPPFLPLFLSGDCWLLYPSRSLPPPLARLPQFCVLSPLSDWCGRARHWVGGSFAMKERGRETTPFSCPLYSPDCTGSLPSLPTIIECAGTV